MKKVILLWAMSRPGVILHKGRGKTPTPWLPPGSQWGKTPPQHLAAAGVVPTPHPFWVGGSPGQSGIFLTDQQVPGIAIVGNINLRPSCGTPGSLYSAPSHQMAHRRMHTHGKPLPGHLSGNVRTGVTISQT